MLLGLSISVSRWNGGSVPLRFHRECWEIKQNSTGTTGCSWVNTEGCFFPYIINTDMPELPGTIVSYHEGA